METDSDDRQETSASQPDEEAESPAEALQRVIVQSIFARHGLMSNLKQVSEPVSSDPK